MNCNTTHYRANSSSVPGDPAAERRARINLGIRRRLAPLLDNDRRKIELLNSLLLSMPGTPVLYYGDEIGMGDNIYVGDRDGVRTPMQWSPDRNGGFSRVNPAKLFLPAIQDPIYGYASVNVEAQLASPSSLLNWMRRMIAIRRRHRAFGRGALRFLYPANRKVFVYIRGTEDECILCVANLSRSPQAVELDLSDFKGRIPIEMTGDTPFPRIGDLPYLLTIPAYGFYWFQLSAAPAKIVESTPRGAPELFTLVLTGGPETIFKGREKTALEGTVAPRFLAAQRWFAGKGLGVAKTALVDFAVLPATRGAPSQLLAILAATLGGGERQLYFVPLAVQEGKEDEALLHHAAARVRRGPRVGLLYDAAASADFARMVVAAIRDGRHLPMHESGELRFRPTSAFPAEGAAEDAEAKPLGVEQSNTSIAVGDQMVLKLYRRLQSGPHPEVEVGRFLTDVAGYRATPALLGTVEHVAPDGTTTALAVVQRFLRNQGDAWGWTLEGLKRGLDTIALIADAAAEPPAEAFAALLQTVGTIGRRTAELHAALAMPTDDPAFASERFEAADLAALADDARHQADRAFAALGRAAPSASGPARATMENLLGQRDACFSRIESLASVPVDAVKTRIHGDYHLGQVLIVQNDVAIVDFEGEPSRPVEQRRGKGLPLRDVAGMLRSFAYAAEAATREVAPRFPEAGARVAETAQAWRRLAEATFLSTYEAGAEAMPGWIADATARRRLLSLALLAKALYEVAYEAENRPDWIEIPVHGVLELLAAGTGA